MKKQTMITILLCVISLLLGFGIGFKTGVFVAYGKWKKKAENVAGKAVNKIVDKFKNHEPRKEEHSR